MHGLLSSSGWRRGLRPAALAALAWLALGAAEARGDEPTPAGPLTQAAAAEELEEARAALAGEPAPGETAPEYEVTLELRDLALALPYLRGAARQEALALLARPPDCTQNPCPLYGDGNSAQKPFNIGWSPADTANRDVLESAHFRIHYVTTGPDAPSAQVLSRIEDLAERAFDVENAQLGWPEAKSDNGIGGDDRVDIYLADLCVQPNQCFFGFAAPDPEVPGCNAPTYRCAAYMVLDNDYVGFPHRMKALKATLAHEYNHILQFRIDAAMDRWVFESTATWIEEHVFPAADDWVGTFLSFWARTSRQPITTAASGDPRQYGTAVWNHWLTRRFSPDVVLDSWLASRKTRPKHFGVNAYQRAIRRNDGLGFAQEFVRFAAATAEWRARGSGFPDRNKPGFVDVKRFGILRPGERSRLKLNHTAYVLQRVRPHGARRLRLVVKAPKGTRSGIALVGRRGKPKTAKVVREVRYLQKGGTGAVTLGNVRRYKRITAVIVNADGRLRSKGFARAYAHNGRHYVVELRRR